MFLRALSVATAAPWGSALACGTQPNLGIDAGDNAWPCPAFLTPTAELFRQFGGESTVSGWTMPELDASFELSIGGLVERELRASLAQLMAETALHVRVVKTMVCVLGLHATAIWTATPLRHLLDAAGIDRARAQRLRLFGADGFENNLRVSDVYDSPTGMFEPLLAFALYDAPLPRELGYPFRLLLANRYGYKNIKWLQRIEVTDLDEPTGQYQQRGYSDSGLIEPVVWVDSQRLTENVRAGPTELCGFALSGHAGVAAVEVAMDGQPFELAELLDAAQSSLEAPQLAATLQLTDPTRFGHAPVGVWVRFRYVFRAEVGAHELRVRVRDTADNTAEGVRLRITAHA